MAYLLLVDGNEWDGMDPVDAMLLLDGLYLYQMNDTKL